VASSLKRQSAGRHVSPHIILITSQSVFVVASSLKQQSAGRHVSPHIILITSQSVFAHILWYCLITNIQWCNGWRCSRWWVQDPVGSNHTINSVFTTSLLCMQYQRIWAKTDWLVKPRIQVIWYFLNLPNVSFTFKIFYSQTREEAKVILRHIQDLRSKKEIISE
jgi:hypothetical protein